MPARSKGLTWGFNLRTTAAEKAAVEATVAEYAQCGIKISKNDAIRILIKRATAPLVTTEELLREQIAQHWNECEHCTPDAPPVCPEGRRLRFVHNRVAALETAAAPPEPAAPAREAQVIPLRQAPAIPPGAFLGLPGGRI